MSIIHGFYQPKPVTVEAFYFDGREVTADVIVKWTGNRAKKFFNFMLDSYQLDLYVVGTTRHVNKGDWVIKTAPGIYEPIGGDIFETTYEVVEPVLEDEGGTSGD